MHKSNQTSDKTDSVFSESKTLILCTLLLFISLQVIGQKQAYFDNLLQKTSENKAVYFADFEKTSEGTWITYLHSQPPPDKNVRYIIEFKTKKLKVKHGRFAMIDLFGKPLLEEHYQNDTLHGIFFCKYKDRSHQRLEGLNGISGIYSKGLRDGNWIFYRTDGKKDYVMSYDQGAQLGKIKIYDYYGNIQSEGPRKNGEKHGSWTQYSYKKSKSVIEYKNGQQEGKAAYYDKDGDLERTGIFENNKEEGKWLFYNKTKDTIGFTFYKNGLLHGKEVRFDEKGDTVSVKNYYEQRPHGIQKKFHTNGQLKSLKTENHGDKEGAFKTWYPSGQLESELYYKNDKKEGPATYYFPDGQLAVLKNWKEGLKDGIVKNWKRNGQLVVSGNYKNDVKHGMWKHYSLTGKLIKKEEYVNGYLKVEGYELEDYPIDVDFYGEEEAEVYDEEAMDPDRIFTNPRREAKPVGSDQLFQSKIGGFIRKNYPSKAKKNKIEGKVQVQVVINKQGEATDFKIVEGIGHGCDEVAIAAIKSAGAWHCARDNRMDVKHQIKIDVRFNLSK